ncbi:MAG: hypothetical protein AB7N91_08280 [Candidatus Tectimicrobiota bacterium]
MLSSLMTCATALGAGNSGHTPREDRQATDGPAAGSAVYTQASDFTLADQHKRWHTYRFPRQKVSFLVMADQQGATQLEAWIQPVYARYQESIEIHGVAAMPAVPESLRGLVRLFFKGRVAYPVMLDWDSRVAQRYGYQQAQANVFIIDTAGRIRLSLLGAVEEIHLQRVFTLLDHLLQEP